MKQKLAIVSTYPPRQCGLATFAAHLRSGLKAAGVEQIDVAALMKDSSHESAEILISIDQHHREDYRSAGRLLNEQGYDAILLQHEFGIFGGIAGGYILDLLDEVSAPVIVTLHTVLADPDPEQKTVFKEVLDRASRLVTMARGAIPILTGVYGSPETKIEYIPHGVPIPPAGSQDDWKIRLGLQGRLVALTFGLLGPGKGIETALRAMAQAVNDFPELLYLVVGATHPEVIHQQGEQYRHSLEALVEELGLQNHVRFVNRFLKEEELLGYLKACDLYLTPYPAPQQITSGTLTYALSVGRAVISTPFLYARELLGNGAGILVPFEDPESMGRALAELAGNPKQREQLAKRAKQVTLGFEWSTIGARYSALVAQIRRESCSSAALIHVNRSSDTRTANPETEGLEEFPKPRLEHLIRLTDDTGVIQHAMGTVPNRRTGYTSDDNARALLAALEAAQNGEKAEQLANTYLAFLAYAQNADGWFHNFFSYDRRPIPEEPSEDCQARCLWALASAARYWADTETGWTAASLFKRGLRCTKRLVEPRGLAGTAVAASIWLEASPTAPHRPKGESSDDEVRQVLEACVDALTTKLETTKGDDWYWFEDRLTYDNALLPLALLKASRILKDDSCLADGLNTLSFLAEATYRDGVFWPIGNRGWYQRNSTPARFDQQPLEAAAMVLACREAWELSGDPAWLDYAWKAAGWFVGQNALGLPLYDEKSGGCRDGLTANGLNRNQGAESTIAWLIAAYSLRNKHLSLLEVN